MALFRECVALRRLVELGQWLAGILNILCMTGWWGIYSSKKHTDMLWPDMTWCYILAYDLWNFEYTYNNLPPRMVLRPCAAACSYLCQCLLEQGGWIQNRANTLALWCMFAQVFPLFQDTGVFAVLPVLYTDGVMNRQCAPVQRTQPCRV